MKLQVFFPFFDHFAMKLLFFKGIHPHHAESRAGNLPDAAFGAVNDYKGCHKNVNKRYKPKAAMIMGPKKYTTMPMMTT